MTLAAVIPFCSFEKDIIDECIQAACRSCDMVYLVISSHLFSGVPDKEGWSKGQEIAEKHTNVRLVYMSWKAISPAPPPRFWHNESRLVGFAESCEDWILFLDSDEIIRDPEVFKTWFSKVKDLDTSAYKLANYWYFLSKRRRSLTLEDSVVLVRREMLDMRHFKNISAERENYFFAVPAARRDRNVMGPDNLPMIDHLSWVRSKDVLLEKCRSWGHRDEKDWKTLIDAAFQEDILNTKDFVHGYSYTILPS